MSFVEGDGEFGVVFVLDSVPGEETTSGSVAGR